MKIYTNNIIYNQKPFSFKQNENSKRDKANPDLLTISSQLSKIQAEIKTLNDKIDNTEKREKEILNNTKDLPDILYIMLKSTNVFIKRMMRSMDDYLNLEKNDADAEYHKAADNSNTQQPGKD